MSTSGREVTFCAWIYHVYVYGKLCDYDDVTKLNEL